MSDPIIEAVAELLSESRAELQAQLDESATALSAQQRSLQDALDCLHTRLDAIGSATTQTVEGALQSVSNMLDQVAAHARTMKELVESRTNDLRGAIGDLEECNAQRAASITKLGERIDAVSDRIDDTESGLLERVDARLQQSDAQVLRLAGLVDGLRTSVAREVRDGRDGEFPPPVPWEAGKAYPQGALVTARGGLFYAKRNTDQDIDGATWLPLARGVDRIEVEHDPDGDDPRTVEIVVTLSDGTATRTATRLPLPLHLGKWLAERHYKLADEVAWNGSTWRAARRSLNETPGASDAWLLVAKSGLRAGKGAA